MFECTSVVSRIARSSVAPSFTPAGAAVLPEGVPAQAASRAAESAARARGLIMLGSDGVSGRKLAEMCDVPHLFDAPRWAVNKTTHAMGTLAGFPMHVLPFDDRQSPRPVPRPCLRDRPAGPCRRGD